MGFAAMIALTVAANLMLKLGAGVTDAQRVLFGSKAAVQSTRRNRVL